jgi:hypothetical protein
MTSWKKKTTTQSRKIGCNCFFFPFIFGAEQTAADARRLRLADYDLRALDRVAGEHSDSIEEVVHIAV